MKLAMAMFNLAAWLPEWMYGRVLLARLAFGYMFINGIAATREMKA